MAAVSDVSNTLDDLELNPVDDNDNGDNVTTTGNRKKELRSQIQKLKKSVAKGDKKKKKEISTEIARLEKELEELLQGQQPEQPEEMTTEPQKQAGKKSRAQKQREKKMQMEQEREKRIAEGMENESQTSRLAERTKLLSILEPLGFTIKDILPDGNCLYSACSEQLALICNKQVTVEVLRHQCSDYIQSNPDMFLSFITDPESQDICSPEYLKTYCDNIIHTTVWGGEVELVALSHVYGVPISVYQSDAPTVIINEDIYDCDNMLRLSYHQHEFSLGRHYNSVVLNNH